MFLYEKKVTLDHLPCKFVLFLAPDKEIYSTSKENERFDLANEGVTQPVFFARATLNANKLFNDSIINFLLILKV